MKRDKWICLSAVLIMLVSIPAAFADEQLDEIVIDQVRQYYSLDQESTEVLIRKNRIKSSVDDFDRIEIEPMTDAEPRGIVSVEASLYNADKLVEKAQVRLRISYFEYVLVAGEIIRRHEIINENNVKLERRDVTYMNDRPLNDYEQIKNIWAKRNIGQDQMITTRLVEEIPIIKQNSQINIVYKNPAFEVSVLGKAMENGCRGETIRVQNSQSKKIVVCTVVDEETVTVTSN